MIHPVVIAYIDLYHEDTGPEPDSGEDKQRLDLTGSTGGQFEVANQHPFDRRLDAPGSPYTVQFGFQPNRRP